ncbi:unnamed protein product [Arctia plantaginis]|uniref:alanine transaminase n=1 Tax=Arctia plantaginis TaxID=874455 RepID=A0A8S0YT74_ARCPL|nr:unnamed protein product [Arctia plantaginis]
MYRHVKCHGGSNRCSQVSSKTLTIDKLSPNILAMEYAVRGPLDIRAREIEKELQSGAKKPFKNVIKANIGDVHAMGQPPITFIRQVVACAVCPSLIETCCFPADVKARACEILESCGGYSVGAYTSSQGIERIRKNIAAYLAKRDGHPSDWENICLSSGASAGIKNILRLFCKNIDGKKTGIMIPIPQYPLYTAAIAELGLVSVGYYLDEDNDWGLSAEELQRSYAAAATTCNVRAIVIINPGNPTGQVLTRKNIESVIKFAHEKNLFIFADEVYQQNIYDKNSQFFSFKKILCELGEPYCKTELASFMSASKCYMGECGLRGGWMEVVNMDLDVRAQLYKSMSAILCPNTIGQIVIDCVVKEPCPGDPSYDLFNKEKTYMLKSLAERAMMAHHTFNRMEGFSCNNVQGAMYAFPRINLPPKAIQKAKENKMEPDVFYAMRLLEESGISVVPGSGFGQKPDTYHFRTTILPQPKVLKEMLKIFEGFQAKFLKEFS